MTYEVANPHPGAYPLEKLIDGWSNAKVTFLHRNGSRTTRYEIINTKTQKRYLQEPMARIAFKAFGLASFVLHAYFFFYGLLHLIRLPIVTLSTLSLTVFAKEIWAIVRFPFYYIGMELAAIYGIVDPLNGRALFGSLESQLHDGKNRRQSQTYLKEQMPICDLLWRFLSEKEHATSMFIGFCMQPIGKTTDPHIQHVEIQNS